VSDRIAIAAGGSIGVAFAIVFARAGFTVCIWDPDQERLNLVLPEVKARLDDLTTFALLDESTATIASRIKVSSDLAQAVKDAILVQECAPENVDLKRDLFGRLNELAPGDAILASSSSAMPVSRFAAHLAGSSRCLVAHPCNPPYLLPVIELVPAPFTDPDVVEHAHDVYVRAGLSPVLVRKEVEGFIFNRLQGAILREAYCLVRDGIGSVEDVDRAVREGPGRRWSFMGPFETASLNTRGGIAAHAQKLGPAYARMGAERGQNDPWTPDLVADVARQLQDLNPGESWADRVAWRDDQLLQLARMKRNTTSTSDEPAGRPAAR